MAELGEIKVVLRAVDRMSPVLRRLRWRLWWYRWEPFVVIGLALAVAFLLGRVA